VGEREDRRVIEMYNVKDIEKRYVKALLNYEPEGAKEYCRILVKHVGFTGLERLADEARARRDEHTAHPSR